MIFDYHDPKVSTNKPIFDVRVFGTTIEYTNKWSYAQDAFKSSQAKNKEIWKIVDGRRFRIQ